MKISGQQAEVHIQRLAEWRDQDCQAIAGWETVRDDFAAVANSATEAQLFSLTSAASALSELMEIAICSGEASDDEALAEIPDFVQQHTASIIDSLKNETESDDLTLIRETIQDRWGELLELFGGMDVNSDVADDLHDGLQETFDENGDFEEAAGEQIDLLLSVLNGAESTAEPAIETGNNPAAEAASPVSPSPVSPNQQDADSACPLATSQSISAEPPTPPAQLTISEELRTDDDLRVAFLDDAHRCLAEMEQVVLDSDQNELDERLRNFCRQLHTLKGASATVELSELASYLHQLEEWLEKRHDHQDTDGQGVDDDTLLQAIDSVRQQIALLETDNPAAVTPPTPSPVAAETTTPSKPSAIGTPAAPSNSSSIPAPSRDTSVRVRAAQLDKLMDMLAELVVIRNRRETRVNDIYQQKEELTRCATRLRKFNEHYYDHFKAVRSGDIETGSGLPGFGLGQEPTSSTAISEIANDVTEVSRQLEDAFKPVTEENLALTHFIRQFRQELMQLGRLPVSGLFQRLNRAARDAARAEDKEIKVHLVGEETGVEQTVQEKLFDPLLHIVRNCVSHGIEDGKQRTGRGKTEHGNITLKASATSSMLVITISDDGKGLDFDAIRRRGYERGLLSPDSVPNNKQLAKLIFHPGFSTRDQASEISGRGIGMDVVSSTLDRMRGRIEVDSQTGSGTTMKICIPLATGIEHAMVFRSGNQLFAMPMRSVASAGRQQTREDQQLTDLSSLLKPGSETAARSGQSLMLDDRIGFCVDEVLGPEEVVVRPLPALLQKHPLLSGAVLAGNGSTVLMLSPDRVYQLCRLHGEGQPVAQIQRDQLAPTESNKTTLDVLVVDDSLSARKALGKRLQKQGFRITEANDGLEAIERLQRSEFDFVFTDLDMPRMGGLELLTEIKQNSLTSAPVVVASSRNHDDVWDRVSEAGAVAFLGKPVSDEALTNVIQKHLDQNHRSDER